MANSVLYQWGAILFTVYPLNVHEVQQVTETDWARKEIVGAAIHHEWVGENDEEIHLRGRVFPRFFGARGHSGEQRNNLRTGASIGQATNEIRGGLGHLDVMDNMRRLAQVHVLVRGDGWHLGWFAIQRLVRGHTFLDKYGIGQQIHFEATFIRFPIPNDPAAYFPSIWSQVG